MKKSSKNSPDGIEEARAGNINEPSRRSDAWKLLVMGIIAVALIIVSFLVGRFHISLSSFFALIRSFVTGISSSAGEDVKMIFLRVRLPRVICAFLAGVGLSVSGAAYQGVFRNPMVSPDLLGATAGAGFGAALAILFSFSTIGIQLSAFAMGLVAVAITYLICKLVGEGGNVILTLVLGGIVVSALFQAGISLMKYVADPYSKLPEITFWLMGTISSAELIDIGKMGIPIILSCIPLYLLRWQVNLLSFSDEEAASMGINTKRIRFVIILCSTLITSTVVSLCGIVGWVGLVIPHLARMLVGPNFKILMPASILVGGSYMLLVDDIARSATAMEIPLGILTAIIGAPFFIYLLCKGKGGWS